MGRLLRLGLAARQPHHIVEPLLIAAMNALLLTGDTGYLEIPRGQLARLIELGRSDGGRLQVPYRHTDAGWTSWRPLEPHTVGQLWYLSQAQADRARQPGLPPEVAALVSALDADVPSYRQPR